MPVADEVAKLFLAELSQRNVPVTVSATGGYQIERSGMTLNISLENLTRDFASDRDVGRISRFVDTVTADIDNPTWDEVEGRVRWQLEPVDMPIADALHDVVSEQVALVLVYVSPDETSIAWISAHHAERWGQTKETLMATAAENMAKLLEDATINVEPIDEHRLGMLSTDFVAFKAALLYTPGFRAKVEPVLGWPIFAVMPCRDFVYLIPEVDRDLLGRVGPVVVRENAESGYPICTEVFEVTDEGLRAFGEFQKQPASNTDGMKTVQYSSGIVNFRLPEHWAEETDESETGVYFDEDADAGTLRLSVITAQSKTPITATSIRNLAERDAQKNGTKPQELANGNWLFHYTDKIDESDEDEALTIHYWQILNPVPPNHLRVVIFSYTVNSDQADEPEVLEELAMLEREIPASSFAPDIGE